MVVRRETNDDFDIIYSLVKEAFASSEHSDGNEQDLVTALRKGEAYVPELSLVAEEDGKIVGHIMFSKIRIGDAMELALAPLAVLPEYQRKGIGSGLIKEAHSIAKELGYHYSVVLGSELYYPKYGYIPAEQFHIFAPFEVDPINFMVYELNAPNNPIEGVVQYAPEFGI